MTDKVKQDDYLALPVNSRVSIAIYIHLRSGVSFPVDHGHDPDSCSVAPLARSVVEVGAEDGHLVSTMRLSGQVPHVIPDSVGQWPFTCARVRQTSEVFVIARCCWSVDRPKWLDSRSVEQPKW